MPSLQASRASDSGNSGLSLGVAYPVVSWMCWVPNLVVAEWLMARSHRGAVALPPAAARRAGHELLAGAGGRGHRPAP